MISRLARIVKGGLIYIDHADAAERQCSVDTFMYDWVSGLKGRGDVFTGF